MAKHFLYLTNDCITGFLVDAGRIKSSEAFSTLDGSTRDLERYLVRHRRLPVFFVVDLTEEDFRSETIPHLRGGDQEAVLNRRLGQVYRASPFRHALVQGREPEGRRDDRVLYHGIPNPDLIKPWLAIIEKLEIPLEGIYSSPVLSGLLLQSFEVSSPHTLLVSLCSGHGLRQTYFQNKHIKFSRLTQLQVSGEVDFGGQVAEECSRTWQYLDSLRFLSGDDQLEVCVLVPRDRGHEIGQAIRNFPLLQFRLLDEQEVARAAKLRGWQGSEFADELWVSLFSQARLQNHFAQSDQTRVARLRRLGVGLQVLSGGLVAAAVVGAVGMLGKAQQLSGEAARLQAQSVQLARQYQQLMSQMQVAQVSADTSKDTAAFAAAYLEPSTTPTLVLGQIAGVISAHPDIRIQHLSWRLSADEKANPPDAPATRTQALPVRTELPGAGAEARDRPSVTEVVSSIANQLQGNSNDTVVPGTDFQVITLHASTGPFTGDYRALLSRMEHFVAELGKLPGLSASLVGAPLDIRPNASVKGELGQGSGAAAEVPFKVRIVKLQRPAEAAHGK